jgi:hypothetical protein
MSYLTAVYSLVYILSYYVLPLLIKSQGLNMKALIRIVCGEVFWVNHMMCASCFNATVQKTILFKNCDLDQHAKALVFSARRCFHFVTGSSPMQSDLELFSAKNINIFRFEYSSMVWCHGHVLASQPSVGFGIRPGQMRGLIAQCSTWLILQNPMLLLCFDTLVVCWK